MLFCVFNELMNLQSELSTSELTAFILQLFGATSKLDITNLFSFRFRLFTRIQLVEEWSMVLLERWD